MPNMSWKEQYADKLVPMETAAGKISSGDVLVSSIGIGLPYLFLDELAKRKDELEGVRFYFGAASKPFAMLDKEYNRSFQLYDYFISASERTSIKDGSHIVYQPIHLSDTTKDRTGRHGASVGVMAGWAPDENGMISLGACPIDDRVLDSSDLVIVQINENLPYVRGKECMFPADRVDYLVEGLDELPSVRNVEPSPEEAKIAALIAERIPDGACIQLGTGGLGKAVGGFLKNHKDLGIHTEMFVETMVDLMECGAVNNSRKTLCPGLTEYGFANGSARMYRFMDRNPMLESRPFRWVNDPKIICLNDNMVSVNGALQIDLTGQVCAESIGQRQFSGTGGQMDFVRGARWSKGGMSFIAMPASRLDKKTGGRVSKISLTLPAGSAVTTLRSDIQYFVTEYGVAELENEPLDERAKRLIAVAHPDFRDELTFQAKKAGLIL